MSKSRSPSIDANKTEQGENLSAVMEAAFQANSKHDEEGERSDDQDGPDASQPDIQQPDGYILSAIYPPQPCERCIRANKTCRGIAGARCEHCKKLKQKCSNYNNAPPRGRHPLLKAPLMLQRRKNLDLSVKYHRSRRKTGKAFPKTKLTSWTMNSCHNLPKGVERAEPLVWGVTESHILKKA
ncbi:hypothetical protein JOM56_008285 [Amanita muscaria]